jgi:hypothetical protein
MKILENGDTVPHTNILNSALVRGDEQLQAQSKGNNPKYPLDRRLNDSHSWAGHHSEGKHLCQELNQVILPIVWPVC